MAINIEFANGTLTSGIGERWGRMHKGLDFAVPVGTNVQSVTNGTVIYTGVDPDGFGNYVKVQDYSGNVHYYAHLSKITTAKGETVEAGQQVGLSGSTGRSTGPHVHYQVISSSGSILNGQDFLKGAQSGEVVSSFDTGSVITAENTGAGSGGFSGIAKNISLALAILVLAFFVFYFIYKTFGGGIL